MPFPDDENSEVIKPNVGEIVSGKLIEKFPSKRWQGRTIYKIKELKGDKIKVILGTSVLDRLMSVKEIGCHVAIKRLEDIPTDKGNPMQAWKTFTLKKQD